VSPARITVGGDRGYPVIVGAGAVRELPALVPRTARTVAVLHSSALTGFAGRACEILRAAGRDARTVLIPDGEAAKTAKVAAGVWSRLAALRVGRGDAIVGVGGGAATDLAGFVAGSWMRGVAVVLLPTSLLAMCDAAIGGKTAINIAEGKNLVGVFHCPAGVIADLDVLATLPAAEYVSGLAEIIKAGFIADPAILKLVEDGPAEAARPGGRHERELIERAVLVKAAVVAADPRERDRRETLNYGHTLGHALELAGGYRVRHGEAVAIGMVFAASLAWLAGRLDAAVVQRHRAILASVGLPVTLPLGYGPGQWPRLREAMAVDKKSRGGRLRFVVLDELARPGILENPPDELLSQAYREVGG
jgi:3-dehydroquinate synthase